MTLIEFIRRLDKLDLDAFASRCSTSSGQLKQIAYGNRRASAQLCIAIERESCCAVRCEVLRPDIEWSFIRGTAEPNEQSRVA